jgi:Uma2 family endonuclease
LRRTGPGKNIYSPERKPLHYQIADNIIKLLLAAICKRFKVVGRVNLRFPADVSIPNPDVVVISNEAWTRLLKLDNYPARDATVLVFELVSRANRSTVV